MIHNRNNAKLEMLDQTLFTTAPLYMKPAIALNSSHSAKSQIRQMPANVKQMPANVNLRSQIVMNAKKGTGSDVSLGSFSNSNSLSQKAINRT